MSASDSVQTEFAAAAAEIDGEPATIDFAGETFHVSDASIAMAWFRFHKAIEYEGDNGEEEARTSVAIFDLLEALIVPEDWSRFQAVAMRTRASGEDHSKAMRDALVARAGRPTQQPVDSSTGLSTTSAPSKPAPSSPQPSLRPVSHIREIAEREGWDLTG